MMDPIYGDRAARWRTYVSAFVITSALFATAFLLSNYFNDRRVADIRATQDDISADILSLETQFDLLQERSCEDISESTILPSVLTSLGNRLSYLEAQQVDSPEVLRLKRLYSLLEIKDYLLTKRIAVRCTLKPIFILYFYSNKGDCPECESQGHVLTALSRTFPKLRIYSFDRNLDISALQTLIDLTGIEDAVPALVIDGKKVYGLTSITEIQSLIPELATSSQEVSPQNR